MVQLLEHGLSTGRKTRLVPLPPRYEPDHIVTTWPGTRPSGIGSRQNLWTFLAKSTVYAGAVGKSDAAARVGRNVTDGTEQSFQWPLSCHRRERLRVLSLKFLSH